MEITQDILNLLSISSIISSIIMIIVQRFKKFSFVKKEYQVALLDFVFSIVIGIPFSIYFYDLSLIESCWVSFFTIFEAPMIYEIMKKQSIINYTPKSLDDEIVEIRRDDE